MDVCHHAECDMCIGAVPPKTSATTRASEVLVHKLDPSMDSYASALDLVKCVGTDPMKALPRARPHFELSSHLFGAMCCSTHTLMGAMLVHMRVPSTVSATKHKRAKAMPTNEHQYYASTCGFLIDIRGLYVVEQYRRHGVGSSLVQA